MEKERENAPSPPDPEAADSTGGQDASALRPEALIAEIYRQLKELQAAGRTPRSVAMTMDHYRAIQRYHATLGETPAPAFDYISKYSVMGLSILIDNGTNLQVIEESAPE